MVNDHGVPTPPPEGAAETRALDRVWSNVQAETGPRRWWRPRTRRARTGALAIAAVLLFGGGVAVGGAALAPFVNPSPAFTVACYSSQAPDATSFRLSYSTESDAAPARSDPEQACAHIQTLTTVENGIDDLVRQQIARGHSCGAIHLTDGTTWSFSNDPKNGLSIESAQPVPTLGPQCVQLHNVTPPATAAPDQFACVVNDRLSNVYPGNPKNARAVCAAKGMVAVG